MRLYKSQITLVTIFSVSSLLATQKDKFSTLTSCYPGNYRWDYMITITGLYWNTHQDGMEYALEDGISSPIVVNGTETETLNHLIDTTFKIPNFEWEFGFKIGLTYYTSCSDWNIKALWTTYHGKANDILKKRPDDNISLLPLWSAYAPLQGGILYATAIQTHWNLQLHLIDIELRRLLWTSTYISIYPLIGIRLASIDQNFDIYHKGGSFSANANTTPNQVAYNNKVLLKNDYEGAGLRGGMHSIWNVGCGWAIYNDFALAILYGRFDVKQKEFNQLTTRPYNKIEVLGVTDTFHASRTMTDFSLGVQFQTMICRFKYLATLQIGWEQHLFWNQNQLWRIFRMGDAFQNSSQTTLNNTGENSFLQRRGDLDVQGWTFTVLFDF